MTVEPISKALKIIRIAAPALLISSLLTIWWLTVQDPDGTTALSDWWAKALMTVFDIDDFETARYVVRKSAHTFEFIPVGIFAMLTIHVWSFGKHGMKSAMLLALAFCAICSIGDQLHKALVPGRHFDILDLPFDAAGYIAGIAIATAITKMIAHCHQDKNARRHMVNPKHPDDA